MTEYEVIVLLLSKIMHDFGSFIQNEWSFISSKPKAQSKQIFLYKIDELWQIISLNATVSRNKLQKCGWRAGSLHFGHSKYTSYSRPRVKSFFAVRILLSCVRFKPGNGINTGVPGSDRDISTAEWICSQIFLRSRSRQYKKKKI